MTGGALVELAYEPPVKRGAEIGAADLVALRTGESLSVGVGLLLLFYSLAGPFRS
ncbi:MAG: hypothetical protein ABEJ70_08245 [Halobacteriaceae archaeon]